MAKKFNAVMFFYERFCRLMFFIKLSGLYLPGIEPVLGGTEVPVFLIYSLFANLITFVIILEEMFCVMAKDLPPIIAFFLTFCAFSYFWGWIKNCYLLINRNKTKNLFQQWSEHPNVEFYPSHRKDEIRKAYDKVMKVTNLILITFVVPYVIACLVKVFWTRTLFVSTSFTRDPLERTAPFHIVLYQCLTVFFLQFGWAMFEATISLLMNLVLAEFKYLNKVLPLVFDTVAMDCSERTSKRLSLWLEHYFFALCFKKNFSDCFSPILAGQNLYIILNMCGLLFSSASGQIPAESSFYCFTFVIGQMIMTVRLCRCGDEINKEVDEMGMNVFPNDCLTLSRSDLQTLLLTRSLVNQSVEINFKGQVPLNSKTFTQMIILQYKFYRFISDMH